MVAVGALVAMSLDEKFDLKEIEDTVRSRVNVKDLRLKLGEESANRPKMRFIEGPPTMNGVPHAGHMRGRVIKDLWFRYKTLSGADVKFTAGWDTQGLPVELQAEKQLGITGGKNGIKEYGVGVECKLVDTTRNASVYVYEYNKEWGVLACYSNDAENEKKLDEIMTKTIDGMRSEGNAFVGFLYAGVIFEDNTPYVLEFNARMGDPECQAILPRMDSDLFEYAQACTQGNLEAMPQMRWKKQSSVCVILASKGYPGKYPTCETISGINSASKVSTIYHAGTKNKDGQILTNGGRVLGVSALGDSLSDASSAAYKACDMIQWQNKYCTADIGRQS